MTTGTKLGPYEILALIDEGGMGEVYQARDSRLDRVVAIKVSKDQFSERFEREALAVAALNHPHICQLYDVGPNYLVMEFVEGAPLKGPLPLNKAVEYAGQILDALDAAHRKGITHRDLKPANILVTKQGIKLLDFGLAKQSGPLKETEGTLTAALTGQGQILGTLQYMSPEQLHGKEADERSDLFSFGCVLYEMLTGRRAFEGQSAASVIAAILEREPAPLVEAPPLARIVKRSLAKDPDQRFQTARDLKAALGWAMEQPPPTTTVYRPMLSWAAAAVFAVVAAVALWAPWRAPQPISQPLAKLSLGVPQFEKIPFDGRPGSSIAVSPDGRRVVYTGRGTDGTFRLYTRTLDQEQAEPLAGTQDAYGPFFSPDGQAVGFFAGSKLKTTAVERGAPVTLCDAGVGFGGSWGEDGNIIAALNYDRGLSRIPSGGGSVEPVTQLEAARKETAHGWPQVLPGARAVVFTEHGAVGSYDDATIEALSLRTGERKTLVRGGYYGRYVTSGHLVYVHQGALYAAPMDLKRLELTGPAVLVVEEVVSSSTQGFAQADFSRSGTLVYLRGKAARHTLVWLDSAGRTLPLRTSAAEYNGPPRFSPDGKRLAVGIVEGGSTNVWVYEWERDAMTRLTFTPGYDAYAVWSPDGKHIAFASRRAGAPNLYWARADGAGEAVRLTESKNGQFPSSFSPDGKRLAFAELDPQTNLDLWTLPLEEVESDHPKVGKPEPFLVTPFNERMPMISPDGRWLAYYANESGRNEVYVRSFPGPGGKWQVSTGGGYGPIWSKKGPQLFYAGDDGMMEASYTADGQAFVSSKPRLWAGYRDLEGSFELTPDGKRFAVLQPDASAQKGPTQVTFLLNFFDELGRRAPAGGK